MHVDWPMSLHDRCVASSPCFFLLASCGSRHREPHEELCNVLELYDGAAVTRLEVHLSYRFPLDAQHPIFGSTSVHD